jgi:predicted small secreted protein
MKSAKLKELSYKFKTNINMKTKTSILATIKAFFILLVSCCLLTSCQNVFVWTVEDMVGLGFIGLLILIGLFIGLLFLIDKIKRWWKGLFK